MTQPVYARLRIGALTTCAVAQGGHIECALLAAAVLVQEFVPGRGPALAFDAGKLFVQRPPLDSEDLRGLRFVAAGLLKDAKNLAPLHFVQFGGGLFVFRVVRLMYEERSEYFL